LISLRISSGTAISSITSSSSSLSSAWGRTMWFSMSCQGLWFTSAPVSCPSHARLVCKPWHQPACH
jgi:hypothetical protein